MFQEKQNKNNHNTCIFSEFIPQVLMSRFQFTSLVAGHETSGSTLFLAMICLALNPAWQKRMQADIDRLFGDRDPSEWAYAEDVGRLFGSCIDAVICESMYPGFFHTK